jgi:NAD(P)-dependent dehydrogenase (short-subunit alcohol dehydrogenase family)
MDVTDNASVERAVDAAIAKAGRLASDAQLFHNPGKGRLPTTRE